MTENGLYPKGRRCPIPRCITVLNSYNPGPCCLLHSARVATLNIPPGDEGLARLWVAVEAKRRELDEAASP